MLQSTSLFVEEVAMDVLTDGREMAPEIPVLSFACDWEEVRWGR